MIVGRGDIHVRQPCCCGSCIDVSATVRARRSFIESNDKKRMLPVRTGGCQWHKRLQKSVTLRGRPIVHVVSHIRDDKGKVDGRIEVRQRLNVGALAGVQSYAFKTDRRIMFADVLPS